MDLKKINENLKSMPLKGKDYIEVNERVKAFRENFEDGFITTEILKLEDKICVIKAEVGVYFEDDGDVYRCILSTGIAYEKEGSNYINKTSFIENCETSAVGRALGFLGIGIDTSIASKDEVENAINNQPISDNEVKKLKALIDDKDKSVENIEAFYKLKLEEFTAKEYADCCKKLTTVKRGDE